MWVAGCVVGAISTFGFAAHFLLQFGARAPCCSSRSAGTFRRFRPVVRSVWPLTLPFMSYTKPQLEEPAGLRSYAF